MRKLSLALALGIFSSTCFAQLNKTSPGLTDMTIILKSVTCTSTKGTAIIIPMRLISDDELTLGLVPPPGRALSVSAVNSKGTVETTGILAPSTQSKAIGIVNLTACADLKAKLADIEIKTRRCGNAVFAKMTYRKADNTAVFDDLQVDSHICL